MPAARTAICLGLLIGLSAWSGSGAAAADPLAPDGWQGEVAITTVSQTPARHSIHAYYLASPESPDGRQVVFFSSTHPAAENGEIRVVDRATGRERTLVAGIEVEDAHRAACQQWVCGGRRVVYHALRGGRWSVETIDAAPLEAAASDLDTPAPRVVAFDRLVGWAGPSRDLVLLYGRHWNPGPHRDLEVANLKDGSLRTLLTADEVCRQRPKQVEGLFGPRADLAIFFPVLSPDGARVFFKLAAAGDGNFRSGRASRRLGLFCCELESKRLTLADDRWGHPAWHPDSVRILEVGNLLIDSRNGQRRQIAGLPRFAGSHPAVSPDGRLFVTDVKMESLGGRKGQSGVVVGSLDGHRYRVLYQFDQTQGATSWRRNDPHPVFSPDGKRIYFNTSDSRWTRLHVVEVRPKSPAGP